MSWIVYHGDCLEILPTLGKVDAVVTDPPYSDATHDGARTGAIGGEHLVDFSSISIDALRTTLGACAAITERWVVATMDWRHVAELAKEPPGGLRFVRFGVWVKPNGAPQFTGDRPGPGWEAVAFMHRDGVKLEWNGGGRSSVFTVPKENTNHPTGKPVRLLRDFCRLFANKGSTILDPFCGSGSTGVAALAEGMNFIGIEREAKYVDIARRRIAAEAAQGKLEFT